MIIMTDYNMDIIPITSCLKLVSSIVCFYNVLAPVNNWYSTGSWSVLWMSTKLFQNAFSHMLLILKRRKKMYHVLDMIWWQYFIYHLFFYSQVISVVSKQEIIFYKLTCQNIFDCPKRRGLFNKNIWASFLLTLHLTTGFAVFSGCTLIGYHFCRAGEERPKDGPVERLWLCEVCRLRSSVQVYFSAAHDRRQMVWRPHP